GYAGVINAQGTYPLQFAVNNAIGVTILNGGNVGIGTTAPSQKLHVNGGAQLDAVSFGVTPGSSQTSALATVEYVNGKIGGGVGTGSSGYTLRHDGTSWVANNLLYNNGTNIGIGTTAPAGKLDVKDAPSIYLGGPNATLRLTTATNLLWFQGLNAARTNTISSIAFSGYNGANRTMDIDLINQRVGIGVTNPADKLHVNGGVVIGVDGGSATTLRYGVPSNGSFQIHNTQGTTEQRLSILDADATHGSALVYEVKSSALAANTVDSAAIKFIVKDNGRVGIGNTSPGTNLDVTGAIKTTSLQATNLGGSGNTFVMADNTGGLYTQDGIVFKRTAVANVNYTAQASDYIIAYTSLSANRVLTLPASVCTAGRAYIIVNETNSAFKVVVTPTSPATISGMTSISLAANNSVPVYCNGTNWFIY
ncbi:MAG: hypothetical protein WCZ15_03750, partial [Patescibacteria group bacterium]